MKIWTFTNGWKRHKPMAEFLIMFFTLLILSLFSISVYADDKVDQPSPELLEFLGEWETKDGEWFNPMWILKNLSSEADKKKEQDDE